MFDPDGFCRGQWYAHPFTDLLAIRLTKPQLSRHLPDREPIRHFHQILQILVSAVSEVYV